MTPQQFAVSGSSTSAAIFGLSFLVWQLLKALRSSFVKDDLGRLLLYWFQNCSLAPLVWVIADIDVDDDEKDDTDEDLDLNESLEKESLSLTVSDPGEKELALSGVFLSPSIFPTPLL